MFKETSAEKLVEYILTLPDNEQKLIAHGIIAKKDRAKSKSKTLTTRRGKSGIREMGVFLDRLGNKLPKNYRFNREEANER